MSETTLAPGQSNGTATQEPRILPGTSLLVDADELAALLSVSAATICRMNSGGKVPRPLRLGGAVRWHRQTVENWLRESQLAGRLLDRREWESLQQDADRGARRAK